MTKLMSVADVWKQSFEKVGVSEKGLREALETHGTYHMIGKTVFLTEQDVADLLRRVSARHGKPREPFADELGQIVYLGSGLGNDKHDLVYVGWSPLGQELDLRERVQEGWAGRLLVLAYGPATPDAVATARLTYRKAYGYLYERDSVLVADMQRLETLSG